MPLVENKTVNKLVRTFGIIKVGLYSLCYTSTWNIKCLYNSKISVKTVHLKNDFQNLGCLKTVEPASRRAGSKMFNWQVLIMEAIVTNKWVKARASFFRQLYK